MSLSLQPHPSFAGRPGPLLVVVADGVGVASAVATARVWDIAASAVLVEAAGGACVALGEPVFPLVVGRDHLRVRVPSAMGPSQRFLEDLVARLTPEDGSRLVIP